MERTAYENYTRIKSSAMYAACVGCTVAILAILALVTGYLVYLGASSLSWSFFTEIPSGNPAAPGG
jgi:ABC-type phosphate transport system permease subunit